MKIFNWYYLSIYIFRYDYRDPHESSRCRIKKIKCIINISSIQLLYELSIYVQFVANYQAYLIDLTQ